MRRDMGRILEDLAEFEQLKDLCNSILDNTDYSMDNETVDISPAVTL